MLRMLTIAGGLLLSTSSIANTTTQMSHQLDDYLSKIDSSNYTIQDKNILKRLSRSVESAIQYPSNRTPENSDAIALSIRESVSCIKHMDDKSIENPLLLVKGHLMKDVDRMESYADYARSRFHRSVVHKDLKREECSS